MYVFAISLGGAIGTLSRNEYIFCESAFAGCVYFAAAAASSATMSNFSAIRGASKGTEQEHPQGS